MQRKYSLDEKIFDELNEENAYWIGLLYADGNCSNENKIRLYLNLESKDLLYSFRNFLKSIDRPIKEKTSIVCGKEYLTNGIELRSWRIHNNIKKYGLTKTKDKRNRLDISLLQPEIRRHFIRGIFDGDGSFYYDGHNKTSLFAEITGYKPLLKDIKNILVLDKVIDNTKKIVSNGKIFRIRLAKYDTIKFIDYIYNGNNLTKLNKKYNLAKQYRERLNEHNS